jgi:hypothetical protein
LNLFIALLTAHDLVGARLDRLQGILELLDEEGLVELRSRGDGENR